MRRVSPGNQLLELGCHPTASSVSFYARTKQLNSHEFQIGIIFCHMNTIVSEVERYMCLSLLGLSAGDIRTAMLLYEAPSGIAVFSFDVSYLNGISKAFWKSLPSLSLEVFIKSKMVPSPIDFANKSVDSLLADSLTELCGSEKTLVVGSAEHKRIIETKLGITCLYVDVPDCEVIICHLKDHVRNLLGFPGDASAMLLHEAPFGIAIFSFDGSYINGLAKDFWACLPPLEKITCLYVDIPDCVVIICGLKKPMRTLLRDEEKADPVNNIISFLHQHYFDIPGGKVEESYYAPALRLHKVELCEKNYLKFFRLLLNSFLSRSGIDSKNWILIQFATVLKMICYPRASYEVYHPDEIFLPDVYSKIVDHSPGYKGGFLKIDVLSLYNEVVKLCSQKCRHLYKLHALIRKAAKTKAKLEKHPCVEVPNGFCKEIYNNESKSKEAAEQTGKLEADNPVLGSVMGELDATSTLLKDKESVAAVRHDSVRPLENEETTRLIDVTIDSAEKEAPDLSVVMKRENENDGLLAKLNHLEALVLEVRKTSEEAMAKAVQLNHKLVAVVMEKVNEKDGLLEKVTHLEAQLLIAKKASEEAKAETPCQLEDKQLDRHSAVATGIETENGNVGAWRRHWRSLGWSLSSSRPQSSNAGSSSSSSKMSHNKVGGRSRSTVPTCVPSICCFSAQ